jgi:glycine cleavage system aminomethyltransferase T
VTSTYYSPTLGKGIAMGLVLHGPDRMGEEIEFNTTSRRSQGRAAERSPRASSARSSTTPRGRSRMSEIAVSALEWGGGRGLVEVREMGLQGMVSLRADLSKAAGAVKKVTGARCRAARGVSAGKACTVAWMSPDELLILCDHDAADQIVAELGSGAEGQHHLAVNVSDARAMFSLTGEAGALRDVLAKITPADMAALAR